MTALSGANGANIFKVSPNISVWGFIESVTNNGYSLWPSFKNVISIMYVCVYVEGNVFIISIHTFAVRVSKHCLREISSFSKMVPTRN